MLKENYPKEYLQGIKCFNEGQYFECHELLEGLWLEVGGVTEIFYQAIIQAAVALYHLQRGNFWGAQSLCESALEKFSKVPDFYMGLSVRVFEKKFREFFEPYQTLKKGDVFSLSSDPLPKMELFKIGE